MTGTTVNAAVAALVAMFTAAAPPGLQVVDSGPVIDPQLDWLAVGYDGSDQPAISLTWADSDAGDAHDAEAYDISSTLSFWTGNGTPADIRAALLAAVQAFRAALRADRTLGGAVMRARFTDLDLDQDVSTLGDVATARFTVHVEAFT